MSCYVQALRSKDLSDVLIDETIRKELMRKNFEDGINISSLSKMSKIPESTIRRIRDKYNNGESLDYTVGRRTKIDEISENYF